MFGLLFLFALVASLFGRIGVCMHRRRRPFGRHARILGQHLPARADLHFGGGSAPAQAPASCGCGGR